MSRKVMFFVIGFFLLAGGLVLWPSETRFPAPPPPAVTFGPNSGSTNTIAAEGRVTVKPDHRAVLSAEVAGRIETILVDNLAPVHKGQVLAVLYNADLDARIHQMQQSYEQAHSGYLELAHGSRSEDVEEAAAGVRKAEADLELAQRNEDRDRKLTEEGVMARSRYDASTTDLKKAQSSLEAAREAYRRVSTGARPETLDASRAQMNAEQFGLQSLKAAFEKTIIRSPLDGIVVQRYHNSSEFADVGAPVLEVADLSQMIVEADVNEIDAGRVREGQDVIVTADAFADRKYAARVYEISAALKKRAYDPDDPAVVVDQKVLPIKVEFAGPVPFKLGMKVDLKIQH
jgi:multidrug resistance efflux pump